MALKNTERSPLFLIFTHYHTFDKNYALKK